MIGIKRFENYNRNKLVWIHGLPGSGKTNIANQINKNKDFIILDDISNISDVENELNKGNNIILSSPYFDNYIHLSNDEKLKNILKDFDYEVEEIWFENNPDQCIQNLKNRTEHKINSAHIIPEVKYFSLKYKIPSSVETIPVWSKNK